MKKKMKTMTALVLLFGLLYAKPVIQVVDLDTVFKKYEGTIVVYDSAKERYLIHNSDRSKTRYTPFSTFKIPNSIIALETGVLKNTETELQWDTIKYPQEEWWPPQWVGKHTMRSAIKYSVVPFYREIATRIGHERMQTYVDKFNFGNNDISSGQDNFWLNGSLSISAMEQIEFLRRLYTNKLGVSPKTIDAVKSILIQEENAQYRLSAKTGAGSGFDTENSNKALGWYVGYVEKNGNVCYFALNIEAESFSEVLSPRKEITMEALKALGVIE